mmetsp:Transcript_19991/g.51044  ORF Transcript_19991/g.51044 Transcript_19991/m.51044 type:complete len:97 (-) Transcript_19991:241-531(-)|eukprot:CAMPEP_0113869714 /NCGR_PEP_ID=MMETSP0780_2-20120614/1688_1 /TAXON_ID=652834 /ORGANISM="Palpitomonas bilix" /LENGTH=96 /DNA_ID=CAMNT_0000854919 /DNA_START=319 /DNA_END=609 /DNA_ORIENTATION=- /assembly_acc=CAM_ASM_000599
MDGSMDSFKINGKREWRQEKEGHKQYKKLKGLWKEGMRKQSTVLQSSAVQLKLADPIWSEEELDSVRHYVRYSGTKGQSAAEFRKPGILQNSILSL